MKGATGDVIGSMQYIVKGNLLHCFMVFIDRVCGIDSTTISGPESIGVDYSSFVPVSSGA